MSSKIFIFFFQTGVAFESSLVADSWFLLFLLFLLLLLPFFLPSTPWDELVDDINYDLLFELFDAVPSSSSNPHMNSARDTIWNFLQSMPTRSSIMDILSSPHTLSSAPFDVWFDPAGYTMKRSRYAKAVYVLQVLDAMVRFKHSKKILSNSFFFFFARTF